MSRLKFFILYILLLFISSGPIAQVCKTDSNYYSIRYNTQDKILVTNGIITPQNELVALCQNANINSSFVTKFTSQGNVLWSNEYIPDYPYVSWLQFPWYTNTRMSGILSSSDSSVFIYGSSFEHGKTVNNVDDPPTHSVGLLLDIDKYGKLIAGKYFGAWRTNYAVTSVIQLSDGGMVVYLTATASPFKSKIICINKSGDIIWALPLEPLLLYSEVPEVNPIMKQLTNGNIVVVAEMSRSIDDTLFYPMLPPIYLRAPLYFFNILIVNSKDGQLISHTSSECPSLVNTNVNGNFIPEVKSITELPNGNLSFCADGYWPIDNLIFYEHKVFTRRAINFITNYVGLYIGVFTYTPENSSCSLESVWQTGSQGEQVLLVKDSTNSQLILFGLDTNGEVEWTKAYTNPVTTMDSKGILLQKKNNNGYSIFQTDPAFQSFDLFITNSIGNSGCAPLPPVKIIMQKDIWPWPQQKVQYFFNYPDIDFRYSSFNIVQNSVPLYQDTYCKYQFECCKDFIDSLKPHNVSVCEDQTYTLPDNTVIKSSGTYYQTLKSKEGCDSVIFYNLKIIKSPSHLNAPVDTCLNSENSIQIIATGGYESYLWNNVATTDSSYTAAKPGSYTVKVQNQCGAKTDTVHVYDKCDFPIYFPNAFTPNGDLLNDVLRVPWANINKLARLRIYNRYGQLVFSTTRVSEGWDGNFKNEPQPVGAYIYILEMRGLAGKNINQKGTVLLLR